MAEVLTLLAEEIGRATALVWGGVGIAIKLNYEVMSTVITLITRVVQLLLLLTKKTAQLFTILANDALLFVGDVGGGVVAVSNTLTRLGDGVINIIITLILATFSACCYILSLIGYCYSSVIDGIIYVYSQLGNLLNLVKSGFVLFGSSVLFAITFIPSLIHLLVTEFAQFLFNSYVRSCYFVQRFLMNSSQLFKKVLICVWNYFTDIPIHAIVGACLGVLIIIGLKYLLQYMIDNLVLIPDIPTPSFITHARRRFFRWYGRIVREARLPPPRENSTDEEFIADASDENGNDNNDNVPDRNLIQEEHPHVPEPPPTPSRVSRPNSPNLPVEPGEEIAGSSRVLRSLARPPLNRRSRTLGIPGQVTESEVLEITKKKEEDKHANKSTELGWAKQLYKELQDEREGKLCVVCQDKPKRVILLPCRHLCLCDACRSAVITRDNICPICRKPILDSLRVFT